MHNFNSRIIIVTGAACRFAHAGGIVIVVDINEAAGHEVANSLQALGGKGVYMHYDLFDINGGDKLIEQAINQFGQVDVLVNNAYPTGMIPAGPIENKSMDGSQKTMQAVFPHMKENQFCRIINMCSLNGCNMALLLISYVRVQ